MFVRLPKSQCIALLALAILWLGLAAGYGQGTIVYHRLSNPHPQNPPPGWDDSGYPMPAPQPLVLDLNGDGQPDIGFTVYDTAFEIYGFGSTRVLTYPAAGFDINSFLPVLPVETEIGATPPSGSLIWRETLYLAPDGRPYSATYNGANNAGYGGYWQGVEGYTGVEFYIGSDVHYAWIRIGAPFVGLYGGYIYDYAYQTSPNTPIKAGQISEPVSFTANLIGANEVPPNRSGHSGTGTFTLESFVDGFVLDYHLELDGAFVPTSVGIFGPANREGRLPTLIADLGSPLIAAPPIGPVPFNSTLHAVNPPIIIFPPPSAIVYHGQITLSSNQAVQLSRGQLYVNLKSTRFRQGELRGQIWPDIPIQFAATLIRYDGPPRNPRAKNDATACGEAAFTLTGAYLDGNVASSTNISWNMMDIYAPHSDLREMPAVQLTNRIGVMIPPDGFPGHPDWPGLPGQVLYPEWATLTDRQVVQLKSGQLFLELRSSRFRNFPISGRIVPQNFPAAPLPSAGR